MLTLPAIDLLGGKCVRLLKGSYDAVTEYSDDPIAVAKQFETQGAAALHVIDLDGAKQGSTVNRELILQLAKSVNIPIEVGGGIRDLETIRYYLTHGVSRVILGTVAIEQPELVQQAVVKFGASQVIVSLDIKDNRIATRGWLTETQTSTETVLSQLKVVGVETIIITDISKDGTLTGANVQLFRQFVTTGFNILAAGGVTTQQDVDALEAAGVAGAVLGKGVYEGTIVIQPPVKGLAKRVIPCLDITNGRVVKGEQFTKLKDVGDAVELAKLYAEAGADELVFLDITATIEGRDTLRSLVQRIAQAINIPFTVGGGIKSVDDIRALLQAGADKVSIGSTAIKDPSVVQAAVQVFGSQCIVISLDVLQQGDQWLMTLKGGREQTQLDAIEFAAAMEKLGVGELLVNSINRDGTNQGYDMALLKATKQRVTIPIIASSGAGSIDHMVQAFTEANVDAVLAAGIFHRNEVTIQHTKQVMQINNLPIRL